MHLPHELRRLAVTLSSAVNSLRSGHETSVCKICNSELAPRLAGLTRALLPDVGPIGMKHIHLMVAAQHCFWGGGGGGRRGTAAGLVCSQVVLLSKSPGQARC